MINCLISYLKTTVNQQGDGIMSETGKRFSPENLNKEIELMIAGAAAQIKYYSDMAVDRGGLTPREWEERAGYERRLEIAQLFQLTEEKRRLLTCVIKFMSMAVYKPKGAVLLATVSPYFSELMNLDKLINSAETMQELSQIGEKLVEFKRKYPELQI